MDVVNAGELIDTLWNVNEVEEEETEEDADELIDTLWNVNETTESEDETEWDEN